MGAARFHGSISTTVENTAMRRSGYAAAMSIAREPDLYKCSIAGAGALDLVEQYRNSDFAEDTRWGHKYLDKVIGPTKEDLIAASPITHIDK